MARRRTAAGAAASPNGCVDGQFQRTLRGPCRSFACRARGSRRERRCTPDWQRIPIAASIRVASAHDSPPIGCPAAASSSVGPSLSNITGAFSGPWGRIRCSRRTRAAPARCSPARIEARRAFRSPVRRRWRPARLRLPARSVARWVSANRAVAPGRRYPRQPLATTRARSWPRQCRWIPIPRPRVLPRLPLTQRSRSWQGR